MDYDLAIIGAGWAGFTAALRAKELGLKTVLIDKGELGGTCLNRGCIPTKVFVQSAKIFSLAKKAANFGVVLKDTPAVDFLQVQARKEKVIQIMRQGILFRLKGVDFLQEEAKVMAPGRIKLNSRELEAKSILIATGSAPSVLKTLSFDGKKIISSDELLNLKEIPRSLLIVGGGVIGCEFASIFNTFGTHVTIAEKLPQLLPNEDKEIAKKLENIFKKKGISVQTGVDANSFNLDDFERVLVCVGRIPSGRGLGLEEIGIRFDGVKISVDESLSTNIPNIYAAGDCTGKVMLAHYAAYQGEIAVHNIARPANSRRADNRIVPNCIFTDPEIASVGISEEVANAGGHRIKVNKFDFMASGMARIQDEPEGLVKIISDADNGLLLGASIIGPKATELIGILATALSQRMTTEKLSSVIFAHPTLSESIKEAL